ncbi:hypothetical protein C8R48DRAFT_732265, partial [Suillus tomentosus]
MLFALFMNSFLLSLSLSLITILLTMAFPSSHPFCSGGSLSIKEYRERGSPLLSSTQLEYRWPFLGSFFEGLLLCPLSYSPPVRYHLLCYDCVLIFCRRFLAFTCASRFSRCFRCST